MEIFNRTCKACGKEKPVFRLLGICVECYQSRAYLARRVKRLQTSPGWVTKRVGTAQEVITDLRDAGHLHPTEAVYMMSRLNAVTQRLSETIGMDDESLAMAEAEEEYTKMRIRASEVQGLPLEQAKSLLEQRETPKLTNGKPPNGKPPEGIKLTEAFRPPWDHSFTTGKEPANSKPPAEEDEDNKVA
jgi:hypothetical protein